MLSNEERREIEKELGNLPTRQSGCVDALKIVQRHRGYISDDSLRDLAAFLDMTSAELDNTATFYNLIYRKPVGRHVIHVCDSISCFLTGEEDAFAYLQRKLDVQVGQTTADGEFTLLPTVCLGHCEQAPVMMLDGEIIGNLTEERIDQALEKALRSARGE